MMKNSEGVIPSINMLIKVPQKFDKSGGKVDSEKSYNMKNGYTLLRQPLAKDANFESNINKQQQKIPIEKSGKDSKENDSNGNEILLKHSEKPKHFILTMNLTDEFCKPRIIEDIENFNGVVHQVETKFLKVNKEIEIILKLEIRTKYLLDLLKHLLYETFTSDVICTDDEKDTWFPRQISDLDQCNHLMTTYEPDLDMNHPGFSDKLYLERRKQISDIAFSFKQGDSIPTVCYKSEEISTWRIVFNEMEKLIPDYACKEHKEIWKILKNEGIYAENKIPQLDEVSNFMKSRTGFTLRPAAGLLSSRDFLASLAFRVFQCTQYVRHHTSPHHSPEPDVIHELLGHAPLLSDPSFADFAQDLGLASLGATDEEIIKFSTMFWFTVEFGLCRENNQLKAWGAGLLSSFGELKNSLSSVPQIKAFDPAITSVQPYQDQNYQKVYFVSETIKDAQLKFGKWVSSTLQRPYELGYNASSRSVYIMNT